MKIDGYFVICMKGYDLKMISRKNRIAKTEYPFSYPFAETFRFHSCGSI